jgi:hypothetical protein
MKIPLFFVALLSFSGLKSQDLDIYTVVDVSYAFSYSDYSRLGELTALENELPEIQFGGGVNLGVVVENIEFNVGIRSIIAQEGEEQRFNRSQARIALGYHIQLSESWKLRPLFGLIEEVGEFQAKATSYILPGPVPVGNFNHYMLEQYYLFVQPGLVWMPDKKMVPFLPDWIELRPSLGIPLGTGTLRWRAGDDRNLLDQSLWDYQAMLDLSLAWKIGP